MPSKKDNPNKKASALIKKIAAKKSFSNGQKILSDANALSKLADDHIMVRVDIEEMLNPQPRFGQSYAERFPDKKFAADALVYYMYITTANLPKFSKILEQYNITFKLHDANVISNSGLPAYYTEIVAGENDIDKNPSIDTLLRLASDIATKKYLTAQIARQTAELLAHKTK